MKILLTHRRARLARPSVQGPGDSQGSPESSEGRGLLGPGADDYRLPITELSSGCVPCGALFQAPPMRMERNGNARRDAGAGWGRGACLFAGVWSRRPLGGGRNLNKTGEPAPGRVRGSVQLDPRGLGADGRNQVGEVGRGPWGLARNFHSAFTSSFARLALSTSYVQRGVLSAHFGVFPAYPRGSGDLLCSRSECGAESACSPATAGGRRWTAASGVWG